MFASGRADTQDMDEKAPVRAVSTPRQSGRRPALRLLLLIGGVLALLLLAAGILLGNPFGGNQGLEREAARLKLPAGFAVDAAHSRVTPASRLCLGDNACPSLSRTWQGRQRLDSPTLQRLAGQAGWSVTIAGDCAPHVNVIGADTICTAKGHAHGYRVVLTQQLNTGTGDVRLTLSLE